MKFGTKIHQKSSTLSIHWNLAVVVMLIGPQLLLLSFINVLFKP